MHYFILYIYQSLNSNFFNPGNFSGTIFFYYHVPKNTNNCKYSKDYYSVTLVVDQNFKRFTRHKSEDTFNKLIKQED